MDCGADTCGAVGAGVGAVLSCGTLKGSWAGVGHSVSGGGRSSVDMSRGADRIGDGIGVSWRCSGGIKECRLESARLMPLFSGAEG